VIVTDIFQSPANDSDMYRLGDAFAFFPEIAPKDVADPALQASGPNAPHF